MGDICKFDFGACYLESFKNKIFYRFIFGNKMTHALELACVSFLGAVKL